jgi:putative glutamine amidotransferase
MSDSPLIGIPAYSLPDLKNPGWFYYANRQQDLQAVQAAGGCPILLPTLIKLDQIPALLHRLDGIYLAGGGDIDGDLLGLPHHPLIQSINRQRDEIELSMARLARQRAMPIIGICRGCQIMNVAAGGSLVIDIPSEITNALQHTPYENQKFITHTVNLVEGSQLASIHGAANLTVNSYHHQSAGKPGVGLIYSAHAPDGVVEALEASDHPFYIGVQWHPERSVGNPPEINKIFEAFIQAAFHFK